MRKSIRAELASSHDEVWKQLAQPGARLSGAERVAIAFVRRFLIPFSNSISYKPSYWRS